MHLVGCFQVRSPAAGQPIFAIVSSLAVERTQRLSVQSAQPRWTDGIPGSGHGLHSGPYSPIPPSLIFPAAQAACVRQIARLDFGMARSEIGRSTSTLDLENPRDENHCPDSHDYNGYRACGGHLRRLWSYSLVGLRFIMKGTYCMNKMLKSAKRDRLADALTAMGYHAPRPQGSFYCFPRTPDRKSTRLNSSHLGISYAVFCLKKKCTTTRPSTTRLPTSIISRGCSSCPDL